MSILNRPLKLSDGSFLKIGNGMFKICPVPPADPSLDDYSWLLRIEAENASRHLVTVNGDAALDGDKAVVFDGTNSYLSVPTSTDYVQGQVFTNRGTVEFSSLKNSTIYKCERADTVAFSSLWYDNNTNKLSYAIRNNTTSAWAVFFEASWTPAADTEYHWQLSRNGSTWRLFVDGVSLPLTLTQGAYDFSTWVDPGNIFTIGASPVGSGDYLDGKMTMFELANGVERDTANFTPPTEIAVDEHTVLALDFAGTAASTRIIDLARPTNAGSIGLLPDISGNELDVYPNAVSFDSSGPKWTVFDGVSSYLQAADNSVADITGRFTMFAIVQMDRTTGTPMVIAMKGENFTVNENQYLLQAAHNTSSWFGRIGNGSNNYDVSTTDSWDTDVHLLTFQYEPSTHLKLWVDGVLKDTNLSVPSAITARSEKLTIGTHSGSAGGLGQYFEGKMGAEPLIFTDELSDADRETVEQLLLDKYNV